MMFYLMAFVLCAPTVTATKKLPENFRICKLHIANYDECMKDAINHALAQLENGIPEIDAPAINPVVIPVAVVEELQFKIAYNNLKLYNFHKFRVMDLNTTTTADRLTIDARLFGENVFGDCNYTLNGNILMLTIRGGGHGTLDMKNVTLQMHLVGDSVKRKDYTHYRLTDLQFSYNPMGAAFKLENAIDGNEQLSQLINKVINDNWEVFIDEFQPVVQKIMGTYFLTYANNILKYVRND